MQTCKCKCKDVNGRVAEWPIASVLKTEVPSRGPWVRILPLPIPYNRIFGRVAEWPIASVSKTDVLLRGP